MTDNLPAPSLPARLWASIMIGDVEVTQRVEVGVALDSEKDGTIKVDADLHFALPDAAPAGPAFIVFWTLRDVEQWLFRIAAGGYAGPGSVIKFAKEPSPAPTAAPATGAAPTEAQVEAAARAFLRRLRPAMADAPLDRLNAVDMDDSDYEILDAMRDALAAALAVGGAS